LGVILVVLGLFSAAGPRAQAVQAAPQQATEQQWVQNYGPFTGSAVNASFAGALALSTDGSRLVVGAGWEKIGAVTGQGAAYVYMHTTAGWTYKTLLASDGATNDHFGVAVAISGDGNTVLVGAYEAANSPYTKQGAAYVFTWSGAAWIQQVKLTESNGESNDFFGSAVTLSADGNTALVGATGYYYNKSGQGGAYIFTRSGTTWTQQTDPPIITPDASVNDFFGNAVALSSDGNTALIGASDKSSNRGAAYAYTRSGASWIYQHEFTASDGQAGDDYGHAVSLSSDGNTALIGADNASLPGMAVAGAAYLYSRSGAAWAGEKKLVSPAGAASEWFGNSVALSSDGLTAVVGVPYATIVIPSAGATTNIGCAWVFYGANFASTRKLVNNDGKQGEIMGSAVVIAGNAAIIFLGSPGLTYGITGQGGVFEFDQLLSPWQQQNELNNAAGAQNDYLGYSLALSGDGNTALVGSLDMKAASVYTRIGGYWSLQKTLHSPDPNPTSFGFAVALSADGNTALVGDYQTNTLVGAAYLFTRSGSIWSSPQVINPPAPDNTQGLYFGSSVALSADGSTAAIGAFGYQSQRGAVYVMLKSAGNWGQLTRYQPGTPVYNSEFGGAAALSNNGSTLLVGAIADTDGTPKTTGAAYAFTRAGTVYTQQQKFIPDSSSSYNTSKFGASVALSGDGSTALVGSPWVGVGGIPGIAYIFTRAGTTWSKQTGFAAPDSQGFDAFGAGAGLSSDGNTAVIGSDRSQVYGLLYQGAAYVYQRSGAVWTLSAKVSAADGVANDGDGSAVAISGDGHTLLMNSEKPGSGGVVHLGGVYFYANQPAQYMIYMPVVTR